MAYKCLFAIVFLACQVQAQASVEVQSGTSLIFTLDQIQPENQTVVNSGSDSTGMCQLIEVAARPGTCDGHNSGHNVKITIPKTTSPPTCPACPPPPPPTTCPTLPRPPTCSTRPPLPGYSRIPGFGCYRYHTVATKWLEAKAICEGEGGHLVVLNSEAEYQAIKKLHVDNAYRVTGSSEATDSWVGYRESLTKQGNYYSVLGEPVSYSGYTRWGRGQPDSLSTLGDFVSLDANQDGLYDWIVTSSGRLPYICEQPGC